MEDWKKRFLETSKDLGYDGEHAKKKKKSSSNNRTSSNSRSGSTTRRDSTGKIEFGNNVSRQERLNFYDMDDKDYDNLVDDMISGDTTQEKYLEGRDDLSPDTKRAGLGNIKYNDREYYTDTFQPQVEEQLQRYREQMNDTLSGLRNQTELAQQENQQYLDNQLEQYQQSQAQDRKNIVEMQNRRGNFYSGATDNSLNQNRENYADARSQLSQNVANRNAQLQQQYAQTAQEMSTKLDQLQRSAPDKVQELVNQAIQGERQAELAQAQVTGMFNGQPTLQAQQMQFEQGIEQQRAQLQAQAQQFDQNVQLQQLAMANAKMQMQNEQWQAEFERDVQQMGFQNAIDKAMAEGKLNQMQAQQAMNQAQFQWQQQQDQFSNQMQQNQFQWQQQQDQFDNQMQQNEFQWQQQQSQQQGSSQTAMDVVPQLTERFVNVNDDTGEQSITDPQGLYNTILSLQLDGQSTKALVEYFGLRDIAGENFPG